MKKRKVHFSQNKWKINYINYTTTQNRLPEASSQCSFQCSFSVVSTFPAKTGIFTCNNFCTWC